MSKKLFLFLLIGLCAIVLTACKGTDDEAKQAEKKEQKEEQKQADEKKVEEDKQAEEQQRAEEEKRKQEEQQRAEEKRKQEEQQRAEEKRKQEEQQRAEEERQKQTPKSVQQERAPKREQSAQTQGGKPTNSQISVGSHVEIILDKDHRTRVNGVVKDILTGSETHTYGIKVRLQDGQIGRVQSVG